MNHFDQILSCCSVFFIVSISTSGIARGTEPLGMEPLRVSQVNPRYFTDGRGRAIYLTGSHTWANLQEIKANPDARDFDYEAFLDFMQEYNHNFMRMWAWEQAAWTPNTNVKVLFEPLPYLRTGPGHALDGGLKFDLKAFNEDYFSRLRSRTIEAGRRGMQLILGLS